MMNNLFDMFDPTMSLFSLNWIAMAIPLILMIKPYYNTPSRPLMINFILNKIIIKDLNANLKKNHFKTIVVLLTIFNMILMMNLFSLLPFIFTPTSHMSLTLSLSLPLWLCLIFKGMIKDTNMMMIHLVPNNTPLALTPFMVVIETISMVIRPMTLMIRLTANMIAGHVLISLLSKLLMLNIWAFSVTMIVMNSLFILETAVAVIQAYVFMTLMSLYIEEIN